MAAVLILGTALCFRSACLVGGSGAVKNELMNVRIFRQNALYRIFVVLLIIVILALKNRTKFNLKVINTSFICAFSSYVLKEARIVYNTVVGQEMFTKAFSSIRW
jgi:hypothetical protein